MLSWTPREKKLAVFSVIALLLLSSLLFYIWRSDDSEETAPFPSYSIGDAQTVEEEEESEMESALAETIWIDVKGAVARPGVYELPKDARVYEVIEQSGGMLPEADSRGVNLAKLLLDGEVVYVPIKGEPSAEGQALSQVVSESPKVNINTASAEDLTILPGIGEVKAAAIIDFRTKQGIFKKESDLKNVSGIGEKLYEKVKEHVRVK